MKKIHTLFKEVRQALDISQKKLAELLKTHQDIISMYERNIRSIPINKIGNLILLSNISTENFFKRKFSDLSLNTQYNYIEDNDEKRNIILGEFLRDLRKINSYNISYISTLTGLSTQTVSSYENGERKISVENLIKLSKEYNIDIFNIFENYIFYNNLIENWIKDLIVETIKNNPKISFKNLKREINYFLLDKLKDNKNQFLLMHLCQEDIDLIIHKYFV